MKTTTKVSISVAASISAFVIINRKTILDHRIKHQIMKRFSINTIYGTWVRKTSSNPFNNRYHGGINIKNQSQLDQYRFTTNHFGSINRIKLIHRIPNYFVEK